MPDHSDILLSREATVKILKGLADGDISREEAANWASRWVQLVEAADKDIDDHIVWDAIENLTAADLKTTDRPYLLGSEDFKNWYDEFVRKTEIDETAH